jgi:hypothetical protein
MNNKVGINNNIKEDTKYQLPHFILEFLELLLVVSINLRLKVQRYKVLILYFGALEDYFSFYFTFQPRTKTNLHAWY